MENLSAVEKLKIVLREKDCPFFSDEELLFFLEENGNDFNKTAYSCLIMKSENTTLNMSGLELGDSSKYFRRLAQKYRESNSCVLGE